MIKQQKDYIICIRISLKLLLQPILLRVRSQFLESSMSLIIVSPRKSTSIKRVGWKIWNLFGPVKLAVSKEQEGLEEFVMVLSLGWFNMLSTQNFLIIQPLKFRDPPWISLSLE